MLDAKKMQELNAWIAMLEIEDSSFENYAKLSNLYTIKSAQSRSQDSPFLEAAPRSLPEAFPSEGTVGEYGTSDFLLAIAGKDSAAAWKVMDNLMEMLRAVNIKTYSGVMRKLDNI